MNTKKIIIVLSLVVSILLMSFNVALAQGNLVKNLDSYIKSDKSEISFRFSFIEMRNNFPDFDDMIEKMITPDGEEREVDMNNMDIDEEEMKESAEKISDYYEELKAQGIDLIRSTDLIYGSGEELPFNENLTQKKNADDINYMMAMVGRYPVKPLSHFFKKEGYEESGNAVVRNFTKESERITISIIKESVIIITPIKANKVIVNRILTGNGLRPGQISPFVKEAERKFDLMFLVVNLKSFGPVKGSELFGNYAGDLVDKDLKFEYFSYGMVSDGKGGFHMEMNVKGTDVETMKTLHENLNGIISLFKVMIRGNKEPMKDALPPEMQNEEVYGEIKDFMNNLAFEQNGLIITLRLSFTETLLDIFRKTMSP
jgi:hypothetical protein